MSVSVLILALVLAVAIDVLLGELPARLHPVVWMGSVLGAGRRWLVPAAGPRRGSTVEFLGGALLAAVVPALFAGLAAASLQLVAGSPAAQLCVATGWITSSFAIRALLLAPRQVEGPLATGDLDAARAGLRHLCSRDARDLTPVQLRTATLESVAENASDSIVAPLFYLTLFGVPGIVAYRAVNTADAMVGYRGRYEWAGKAAARLDDVLNLVPARLTAVLLLLAGVGARWLGDRAVCPRAGLAVAWRDAGLTPSPNAGWPMAAMAGLLAVRLDKPGVYVLGASGEAVDGAALRRGVRLVAGAAGLAVSLSLAVVAAMAWGVPS